MSDVSGPLAGSLLLACVTLSKYLYTAVSIDGDMVSHTYIHMETSQGKTEVIYIIPIELSLSFSCISIMCE